MDKFVDIREVMAAFSTSNKNDIAKIKKTLTSIDVNEKYFLMYLCAYSFNIGVGEMLEVDRKRHSSVARYMNWTLLKKYYCLSSREISCMFNMGNYSIIDKGISQFKYMLRVNSVLKNRYKSICDIFEYLINRKNDKY